VFARQCITFVLDENFVPSLGTYYSARSRRLWGLIPTIQQLNKFYNSGLDPEFKVMRQHAKYHNYRTQHYIRNNRIIQGLPLVSSNLTPLSTQTRSFKSPMIHQTHILLSIISPSITLVLKLALQILLVKCC